MTMQRWKLIIEYDGSPYRGWQKQKDNLPTVQAALEQSLYDFCGQEIAVHVAGRTDAGVHAAGQVVHLDLDYGERDLSEYEFAKAINALIRPHPISVLKAEKTHADFHARFDAKNKLYIYRCLQRPAPPTIDKGKIWHVKRKWDIEAMKAAAQHLLGHHDFTSFRSADCQAKTPMRTLDRAEIITSPYDHYGGLEIQFHFEAQSFLYHQVRNMVGTLSLVGVGRIVADDVRDILAAKDRTKAGPTIPSDGLSLVRIDY